MRACRTLVACVLLGACGDLQPPPDNEVAAELRALRAALAARDSRPPAAGSVDPTQVAAALQPLREALDGIVRQQGELQQRQVALTQEMQRWSQLLVDGVGAARRQEIEDLTNRLQAMETALKGQEQRHREVETLLQGALDRTADRLEEFLRRVAPPAPGGDGNASKVEPPAPERPKSLGAAPRTTRASDSWWWAAVTALGLGLGVLCFRKWRRDGELPAGTRRPGDATSPSRSDQGAQEIWAAAALLGEAVGRLRESSGPPVPAAADELIVLDDELLQGQQSRPDARGANAPPGATTLRVRARDPERAAQTIERVLAGDPRVLRRPAPEVHHRGDRLEISFRTVPLLPPGDLAALEQRLHDAGA